MVVTFYSYKGGVGRSMALANVAELLASFGYRVIVCDWDLEAPGLERYFVVNNANAELYRRSMSAFLGWPGLVDLLVEYKDTMARPLDPADGRSRDSYDFAQLGGIWLRRPSSYARTADERRTGPGSLRLLTAGRRRGEDQRRYGEAVRAFDWQQFYDQWAGDAYMDFFRRDLVGEKDVDGAADVLLIDSRTGVTEQGGVCTHHLADLVLVFTAANDLNIEGARWMVQTLGDPQLVKARGGRPLGVLPIASRIEQTAQTKELVEFRRQFIQEFGATIAKHASNAEAFAIGTEIPYMPYYSYHERVVAREPEDEREQNLFSKYRAIADAIVEYGVRSQLLRERTAEGITARATHRGQRDETEWKFARFAKQLQTQLDARDTQGVALSIEALERELHSRTEPFPEEDADYILELVERSRQFATVQAAAEAFVRVGLNHPALRLTYARSLIEQGNGTVALSILPALIAETAKDPAINTPARMLVGRIFRDQYLQSAERSTAKAIRNLERAVNEYYGLYRQDPENLRAAINVVGLVARASRDGIQLSEDAPNPETLAAEILRIINSRRVQFGTNLDWRLYAIAVVAALAVKDEDAAIASLIDFANDERVDNFSLMSLRDQLTTVWDLTQDAEPGISMLGILDGAILSREGGRVVLGTGGVGGPVQPSTSPRVDLETLFGADRLKSLEWFRHGLQQASCVVRVDSEQAGAFGTGFVMAGRTLHEPFGDSIVLVTAAHVLSPDPSVAASVRPSVATVVRRNVADDDRETVHRVRRILFTSPPDALDVTVAELEPPVTEAPPLTIGGVAELPAAARVTLVGHAGGRELAMTEGNVVDSHETVVRYRCAAAPGASGSPVFDDRWRLIALHHAVRPRAESHWTGPAGTTLVSEGISMAAIAREIGRALGTAATRSAPPRASRQPVRVFISYAHEDHELKEQLSAHLLILERRRLIELWSDDKIPAGDTWEDEIRRQIDLADIVLMLVSVDYLTSEFLYSVALPLFIDRARARQAIVMPIIVRPVNWSDTPIAQFQAFPKDGTPVTVWSNRDAAWANVAQGVLEAVDRLPPDDPTPATL